MFETTEQALEALDNAATSMAEHPMLTSIADMQRHAVAFLRESLGAAVAAKTARNKRG